MDWQDLKKKIYFEDGSLRDIYILNTTRADWQAWIDLVNKKYVVEFHDFKTDSTSDKIDFKIIKEYWDSKNRESIQAKIKLNSVVVMCYFFDDSEIENDIDPEDFTSKTDHENLIRYLDDVSTTLNKEVYVTGENMKEALLLKRIPLATT